MKTFRHFCTAVVLTLSLALSAFAGEMQFPGITATGDMQAPGVSAAGEIQLPGATADTVTEMALGFLLNVSSLI